MDTDNPNNYNQFVDATLIATRFMSEEGLAEFVKLLYVLANPEGDYSGGPIGEERTKARLAAQVTPEDHARIGAAIRQHTASLKE